MDRGRLASWIPHKQFTLVTTHYAHPATPQLSFYDRISHWVAPGDVLLIVGHAHSGDSTGHEHDGQHPPLEATVTLSDVTGVLGNTAWAIVTAEEHRREPTDCAGRPHQLRDVVLRARHRF